MNTGENCAFPQRESKILQIRNFPNTDEERLEVAVKIIVFKNFGKLIEKDCAGVSFNPLSASPTKLSNTLIQFVGIYQRVLTRNFLYILRKK